MTFEEFIKLEITQINKYRITESEKVGYDIGKQRACQEWVESGQAAVFRLKYKNEVEDNE